MKKQQKNCNGFTTDIIETILTQTNMRTELVRQSHYWFFNLYFYQYVKYPTAEFQKEIFAITEDDDISMAIFIAFRGCGKSTIVSMSYPIWAILGRQQKKCVVILSQTQQQSKNHFMNIKRELEGNLLLQRDLGPFQEESDEWGSFSLVIPRYNAKIVAASSEQSIRGIRHGSNRPDLIICDDVEDLSSVKTRESREKTYNWLMGEVLPAGDTNTRIVMVGNLLHEDSLLMRLKKAIAMKRINAVFHEYPIMNDEGTILWPGKFKTTESLEAFKVKMGDEKAWQREFLLKIIADEEQVIKREWIKYYDKLPKFRSEDDDEYRFTATGVDLAISQRETADYTAAVTAHIYGSEKNMRVYILPNVLNERLTFSDTLEKLKKISRSSGCDGERADIFVEDVGYQKSLIQTLLTDGYHVEGVPVHGQDKRSRLNLVSHLFATGKVLFPREGAEQLIQQLLYFGVEKHDDLTDALTTLLMTIIKNDYTEPIFSWIGGEDDDDDWDDED